MRKLLLSVILVAGVAVSCQREPSVVAPPDNQSIEDVTSEYAISEEEALARLDSFMAQFEGATRSTSRRVRSINPVSYEDVHVGTRSSEELDVENLLYIVEFEDGQGSAIIGADERVEPVYAVLDETVLTIEDFNNAANGTNTDDIRTFTAGMIAETASLDFSSIPIGPPTPITPPDDFDTHIIYSEYVKTVTQEILPMLTTKWRQGLPYNSAFPPEYDAVYGLYTPSVGCGTIAVAQVLAYNARPVNQILLNGEIFYWSIIRQNNILAGNNLLDSTKDHLYRFLYALTESMDPTYTPDGTIIIPNESVKMFRQCGYKNVNYVDFTENLARNMVLSNLPFYIYGRDTNGTATNYNDDDEHAWVIDGLRDVRTDAYQVVEDNGEIISRTLTYSTLASYLHCNYGWGGNCDGYYICGIFDTTQRLDDEYIENEYGDIPDTMIGDFVSDISIITYTL